MDDLIPELKLLSKAKRRRVTERATLRAFRLIYYFIALGAATGGALFVRPLRHAGAPEWLVMAVPVACGVAAVAIIFHHVVRKAERFAREDLGIACKRCGYDIRGSRWQCPECGEAFR
jgi:lipopolysaccharide biosynthesis regulator YciM